MRIAECGLRIDCGFHFRIPHSAFRNVAFHFPCILATTSSLTFCGACSYRSKCIEYVARPWVRDRRSVAYPNMSDSGTRAEMICVPPRSSCDWICPRRLERLPITSPMYSFGTTTSTRITGSSSTGLAFFAASWNAIDPAILNAISDESTS